MKKCIIALLFLFLASAPVQTVSAAEVVSLENYFETVDGGNEEIHYETYKVITSDTTLSSSAPGAVKFNYIQGNTYQAAAPSPSNPQELQSVVLNGIKITDDNGNFSFVTFSNPIELNAIGDVRDCIVKKDGVWKIERNFAKELFDGSDDENIEINTSKSNYFRIIKSDKLAANGLVLTSHYVQIKYAHVDYNDYGMVVSAQLNFKDIDCSSLEEFKTKLQSSPMTILYELATPIYEDLPIDEQLALNKLETFQGTSYVLFDSAISPEFQLEYFSFVKKVYDSTLEVFVSFMRTIFDFVATEFTIWGFTFSYWQIIILSCLASILGYFIHEVFS